MARRLQLQAELEDLLGSKEVYFQPPESKKLVYPCIIYNKTNIASNKADNKNYTNTDRYDVMFLGRDPDTDMPNKILEHFEYCNFSRRYVSDNIYHDVLSLYY